MFTSTPLKRNKEKKVDELLNYVFDNNKEELKNKLYEYLRNLYKKNNKNSQRIYRFIKQFKQLYEKNKKKFEKIFKKITIENFKDKKITKFGESEVDKTFFYKNLVNGNFDDPIFDNIREKFIRGTLKEKYKNGLSTDIKAALLYRDAYELDDNPYNIPVADYINIIKQYRKYQNNILKNKLCKQSGKWLKGLYLQRGGITTLVLIFLVIAFGFGYIMYTIMNLYTKKDNKDLKSNIDASDEEKEERLEVRQTIASLFATICFSTLNATADGVAKIDAATSTVLIGMILGNTIGFIFDQVIASEEALQFREEDKDENGLRQSMRYAFGSLVSSKFSRFFLTVIIDAFVSLIFFKVLYPKIYKLPGVTCLPDNFSRVLANFITTFLISVSTFMLYAQKLRSNWAYPPINLKTNEFKVSSELVLMFVTISAGLFAVTNTQLLPNESSFSVNNPRTKTIFVVIGMLLAVILNKSGYLESKEKIVRSEEFDVLEKVALNNDVNVWTATQIRNEMGLSKNEQIIENDWRKQTNKALFLTTNTVVQVNGKEGHIIQQHLVKMDSNNTYTVKYDIAIIKQVYKNNIDSIYTKEETADDYFRYGTILYITIALLTTAQTLSTSKKNIKFKLGFGIVFLLLVFLPVYFT